MRPPVKPRTILSTNNWFTSAQWLAPSADRTAISFCRPPALASSRFATFAQAISRTKHTAPNSANNVLRVSPSN